MDPDYATHFVGPDLGPNCLQRLSADDTSRQRNSPLEQITVKPAVAATSIKRDPSLSGHIRAPRTIFNANTPLLSVHLSNGDSFD